MKKLIRGFTLVELIVVMAIMTILMAAILQMMKPIRSTYIDSTLYESNRNTMNGISQYLTESVRYATDIGIYSKGYTNSTTGKTVTDVYAAEKLFLESVGLSESDARAKDVEVITVDSRPIYSYGGTSYMYGRLIRRKTGNTLSSADEITGSSGNARLALGDAYYGEAPYFINVGISNGEFNLNITYYLLTSGRSFNVYEDEDPLLQTSSTVILQNIKNTKNNGTCDTTYYKGSYPSLSCTSANNGELTYIVFLNPKI